MLSNTIDWLISLLLLVLKIYSALISGFVEMPITGMAL